MRNFVKCCFAQKYEQQQQVISNIFSILSQETFFPRKKTIFVSQG
jgi:hypothetical protein